MIVETLYEYYATKSVRPTFANFGDDAELGKYAELRENVFYRLLLPTSIFSGKRLLEFGPDTGENSLVFAKWGAKLSLVEPNAQAHPFIRSYFTKFGLDNQLNNVTAASLLGFAAPHKFDIIDAEGFIYTIQPNSAWIKKTGECLERGGFLIISYMELYGSFIELLTKALYKVIARNPNYGAGIETAKRLFLPKWNRVQHTRTIDSWFMDVIENPFVRRKYFIDPIELLRDMHTGGFRLYSSWPNYRDTLTMQWIKAPLNQETELQSSISFVERSRLSHLLGCNCFLPGTNEGLAKQLSLLMQITDDLIDASSQDACAAGATCVDRIEEFIKQVTASSGNATQETASPVLAMIKSAFQLMKIGDTNRLADFCQSNKTFISNWGMPAHYAVFQRI